MKSEKKIGVLVDFGVLLSGISFVSKKEARKALNQVTENGVPVYQNIQTVATLIPQEAKTPEDSQEVEFYEGEVIIYSISTGDPDLVFAGMVSEILVMDVAEGTSRGQQLKAMGGGSPPKQWMLLVKRMGCPKIYDLVDQFGVGSRLIFVMDALRGNSHEVPDHGLTFDDVIVALSNGCLDIDRILLQFSGRAMKHERNVLEALQEKSESDKPLH
jgi:hypothetical protein